MFYSQLILAKKGPLGTIWIAAHLERKLRKNQVTETNIGVSVDSILFPEAPIALRLSGHLLLGVVRIYSRKVNYLFHDCSEALTKIKQAFHAGAVDLPPESSTAPFHAITLPENFDLDEFEPLAERESSILASGAVDQHVTTRELITLQDPLEENIYFGSQFGLDERLPQADLPRMALDFEEQFKSFLVTNLRIEDVSRKRLVICIGECDLVEILADIDGGDFDDLDLRNSEEREKEAQEDERSPRLALEEEVAPSGEEYRIDFDRLDQMEAMDVEQLQPMTPAPPSMMDLDEEMEDHPEQRSEDLEQLAPIAEVVLNPGQMEIAVVPRTPAVETQAEDIAELEEQVSRPLELEAQVEAPEAGENIVEVPDELVPALESAAEQVPKVVSPGHLSSELEDVPEIETLRSAVDAPTNEAPNLFAYERERAGPSEDLPARDTDQHMVAKEHPLEFTENLEELRETSDATIPGLTSPRRRPSLDLPADDDVLGTLLGGRSTPSLGVMPTPSEEAPTRRGKRTPKPPPRKRKPVLDAATVLHGDVMREQLANTTDIRRVRKKAPCTQSELWTVQRQSIGQQVFNEPSIPGLSNALRELYARVLVTGTADLPLADPRKDVTPEVAREDVPGTPRAEVRIEEPETIERAAVEEPLEETRQALGELNDEPGLESAVLEPAVETVAELQPETGLGLPAEVDSGLEHLNRPEEAQDLNEFHTKPGTTEQQQGDVQELGTIIPDQDAEFPTLDTEPGIASEPPVSSSAPTVDPILVSESGSQEGAGKDEVPVGGIAEEFDPMDEDEQVIESRNLPCDEGRPLVTERPELLQQVAEEAEAVADAVAGGEAVVVDGVDGRTVIVLEDDGTIIDEGPSQFSVKEEIIGEEANEEELGFLGEPRETVFLQDDDDDLHEEAESYDDSVQDVTLQGFGGWSARTRAVGGYLQGVFESLNGVTEIRGQDDASKIGLDRTLRGKTRKEAARLFFETLVLKTKDYVGVEQPQPYDEIYLSARPKLTKATF